MADFDDDLGRALRTLAADGRRGPGQGSGEQVRRLAERRQARQRAVTAAVVVLLLLVGGGLALTRPTHTTPPAHQTSPSPVVTPSPTPTQSPSPSSAQPSHSVPPPSAVPTSALLTASDVTGSIEYASDPAQVQSDRQTSPGWPCAPTTPAGATARTVAFQGIPTSAETVISQEADSFATVAAATAGQQAIEQAVTTCVHPSSEPEITDAWSETGVGDGDAYIARLEVPGDVNAHAVHEVWLEVARTGTVVTWVSLEFYTQDVPEILDTTLRQAVTRLCSVGGGSCVNEPVVRHQTYPIYADVPSLPTGAQVGDALGGHWQATGEGIEGIPDTCTDALPQLKTAAGRLALGSWQSDQVDTFGAATRFRTDGLVGEEVRGYASAQWAQSAATDLANAFDHCTDRHLTRLGTDPIWSVAGSSREHIWYAVATKGSRLIGIELRAEGHATAYTAPQINALIATAEAQLS